MKHADPGQCPGRALQGLCGDGRTALAEIAVDANHDQIGRAWIDISFWHGLWTTKDTPKDVVARLDAAVVAALANAAVRAKIEALGQVVFPANQQNPQALAAYPKADSTNGGRSWSRRASKPAIDFLFLC